MNEVERMAEMIEKQRKTQEAKEQEAINKMINNKVEDRFKEFPRCMKCGKIKEKDNYPICNNCWKQTDEYLRKEEQDFIQGKYFAGMNQVVDNADEDDFTNLMTNLDKYIK